jgi:hypothetical protein
MTSLTVGSAIQQTRRYAVAEKALRRWARERLRRENRSDGGVVYSFALSGSTCNNMGRPIEVTMTVAVGPDALIESTSAAPAENDNGCDAMCAAAGAGRDFLAGVGACDEAIGLTLEQAASRDWQESPSGCFCTPANRRHKWRNVFQALHYAMTQMT